MNVNKDTKGRQHQVLIVDDEDGARQGLSELLTNWGYITETARDGIEAVEALKSFHPSMVITDLSMPNMDGIELLKAIQTNPPPHPPVVLLTAHGTIEIAVEAIRGGAYDFLTKPVDIVRLQILVEQVAEHVDLKEEVNDLRSQVARLKSFEDLIGTTPQMKEIFRQIKVIAPSSASVVIEGPSGTGKELVARAVHNRSLRNKNSFVAINCSAIPSTLLESEIFGHEKGAFTGAIARKLGCFELAHKGTLFLDEIAEMPFELQAKFLRVLEDGSFRRVGGKDELTVDVRVVAASNKNFNKAISNKEFREDLYYRLNVFTLLVPPLETRRDDIPLLAIHFMNEFATKNGKKLHSIESSALNALQTYHWPGNVRELKNVIERAVILSETDTIGKESLPEQIISGSYKPPEITLQIGDSMKTAEKIMIRRT